MPRMCPHFFCRVPAQDIEGPSKPTDKEPEATSGEQTEAPGKLPQATGEPGGLDGLPEVTPEMQRALLNSKREKI